LHFATIIFASVSVFHQSQRKVNIAHMSTTRNVIKLKQMRNLGILTSMINNQYDYFPVFVQLAYLSTVAPG